MNFRTSRVKHTQVRHKAQGTPTSVTADSRGGSVTCCMFSPVALGDPRSPRTWMKLGRSGRQMGCRELRDLNGRGVGPVQRRSLGGVVIPSSSDPQNPNEWESQVCRACWHHSHRRHNRSCAHTAGVCRDPQTERVRLPHAAPTSLRVLFRLVRPAPPASG